MRTGYLEEAMKLIWRKRTGGMVAMGGITDGNGRKPEDSRGRKEASQDKIWGNNGHSVYLQPALVNGYSGLNSTGSHKALVRRPDPNKCVDIRPQKK